MAQNPRKTALLLCGVVATMGTLSFVAVPFYDWFCRTTGFAGTTMVAAKPSEKVLDQTVLVRFDASKAAGMPWDFKPQQLTMRVKIGETNLAFYEAHNLAGRTVAGTASYNVTPNSAGNFFVKIDCFCFEEQVLKAGETAVMPVSFYVDPEIVNHDEAKTIKEITLSYTFHQTDLPAEQAAAASVPDKTVN